METKNLEEMTKEELIELVGSLTKELEKAKSDLALYQKWKEEEKEARMLAEKKILAGKAFFEVL